jgi:phosphonate transport system permease protein
VNEDLFFANPASVTGLTAKYSKIFTTGFQDRVKHIVIWLLVISVVFFGLWRTGFFNWQSIYHGIGRIGAIIKFMLPPAHHGWLAEFLYAILETMSMAFLGTLIATIVSIPLGFIGAKNMISNALFHFSFRRIFDGIRGIDALIWALIFVNVVGLGPFAGIMAIAVSDIGTLSKLFAEAIENIDQKQIEGVHSCGAGQVQTMRYAVFPQIFPVILSNALYFFESNIRSATILGVVGAGGIGLQLSDRIRVNNWDEAAFIILLILVTVSIIDTISKEIRIRMINYGKTAEDQRCR